LLAVSFAVLGAAPVVFSAEEKPAGEKAAGAEAQASSVSAMVDDPNFHYESAGRRDPFKSLLDLGAKPKDPTVPLPPIQKMDLNTVTINGVILDDVAGNQAMIKSGSQSFVVKTGMIIGQNEGEIIEVTLDGIRVVEKFVDFMGRETLKEIFIKSHPTKTTNK
jgi:Tfp pilus assembly protein PilP